MKVPVYNLQGKATAEVELAEAVFNVPVDAAVVHQVFVAQTGNARESWADTKGRGEVRGGGKKPWQQKGTGRARHGSIRSPIWKGGGVTFGPKSQRNYKTKVNKQTRRLAIKMCLSDKVHNSALLVVERFDLEKIKTKLLAAALKALPLKHTSCLVVTPELDERVVLAARNLPRVATTRAMDLNVVDLLQHQAVVTTPDALTAMTAVLTK